MLLAAPQVLTDHQDEVWHLHFAHKGHMMASASKDGTAIVWDIGGPRRRVEKRCVLRAHAGAVLSVAWSPDDSKLATCGQLLARAKNAAKVHCTSWLHVAPSMFCVHPTYWRGTRSGQGCSMGFDAIASQFCRYGHDAAHLGAAGRRLPAGREGAHRRGVGHGVDAGRPVHHHRQPRPAPGAPLDLGCSYMSKLSRAMGARSHNVPHGSAAQTPLSALPSCSGFVSLLLPAAVQPHSCTCSPAAALISPCHVCRPHGKAAYLAAVDERSHR